MFLDDPSPDRLAALHSRLVEQAAAAGLLDVAYRIVDSPVGALLVAATDAGVVRVAFASEGHDAVLAELAGSVSARLLEGSSRLDAPARQLDEYFTGRRRAFDVDVDLRLATGFRRAVLDRLRQIPYGETATYAGVAAATGRPRAFRAVGTACGHNPVPLVVPCHRVVRSDGTPGEYRGGAAVKATLLALEAA